MRWTLLTADSAMVIIAAGTDRDAEACLGRPLRTQCRDDAQEARSFSLGNMGCMEGAIRSLNRCRYLEV